MNKHVTKERYLELTCDHVLPITEEQVRESKETVGWSLADIIAKHIEDIHHIKWGTIEFENNKIRLRRAI